MSDSAAFAWLSALTLVGVVEAVTALSYLPAYRHHWRRWVDVDWRAEWPYMWPPLFLNGALWFLAQFVNAMGIWFVLRLDAGDDPLYHAVNALWVAALGVWSLWAVPWEMEMPAWTVATWGVTALLSAAAAVLSWLMETRSLPGAILLTAYSAWVFFCLAINGVVLVTRRANDTGADARLHQRIGNPFGQWIVDGGWPHNYYG